MAGTVTLLNASQNALRYTFIAVGANTNDDLTQTAMIADCMEGPLKQKLSSPVTNGDSVGQIAAWDELVLDMELTVIITPQGATPALVSYEFKHPAAANLLRLVSTGAGQATVEIRFNPTLVR